ncbi:hypothetical protein DL98DRAFT_515902 [Cadophora sp. DSE1049]|nr:hypothetical protein DL98DRAFT_515902 [Cadophora sp. DSE1049]
MGLPNSVRWYHLLGFFFLAGSRDLYRWTLNKIRETYDRTCDSLNSTIHTLQITSRGCLHILHLAPPPAFGRFGDLPLEIRQLVWQFAASEPRVVELRHATDRKSRKHILSSEEIESGGIWSIAEIPPVLHASRESRIEGLKSYKLAFGTQGREARVYVNFENDIVLLGRRCPMSSVVVGSTAANHMVRCVRMNDLEKIVRLAIRSEFSWAPVVCSWDKEKFRNVREVILVGQSSGQRSFDLGRRPDLRVRGEMGGVEINWDDVGSTKSHFRNYVMIRILEDRVGLFGEELGESGRHLRRDVLVKDGTFVKGLRDKWFSPRRSWIF